MIYHRTTTGSHQHTLLQGAPKNCRCPALEKLAGSYKTLSRKGFLMVRRQPAGELCSIFRGALQQLQRL